MDRPEADFSSPHHLGRQDGLAFAVSVARNMCDKCDGAGWLWGYELDTPPDRDPSYGTDDTRYSCDGLGCKIAKAIGSAPPWHMNRSER